MEDGVVITAHVDSGGKWIGALYIDGQRESFFVERRPGCAVRACILDLQQKFGAPPEGEIKLTLEGW